MATATTTRKNRQQPAQQAASAPQTTTPSPTPSPAPSGPAAAPQAAQRYTLGVRVDEVKAITTKQEPEKGHGKEWRAYAVSTQSIRSRVMEQLKKVFKGKDFTEADAAEALKGMHLGRRTHTAYARLLVVRGYIVPVDAPAS